MSEKPEEKVLEGSIPFKITFMENQFKTTFDNSTEAQLVAAEISKKAIEGVLARQKEYKRYMSQLKGKKDGKSIKARKELKAMLVSNQDIIKFTQTAHTLQDLIVSLASVIHKNTVADPQ